MGDLLRAPRTPSPLVGPFGWLIHILPARVAVSARLRPNISAAASNVAPVVSTSSTSTLSCGTEATGRNPGGRRAARLLPAWAGHHSCGRRAATTGTPVRAPTSRASVTAGSVPYLTLRAIALGTGTRADAPNGTSPAIAVASTSPAEVSPSYLRRWTRRRAEVS